MGIFIRVALSAILVTAAVCVSDARDLEAVPGEFLVRIKSSAFSMNRPELEQSLASKILREIPSDHLLVLKRSVVEVASSAIESLSHNPYVEVAEPNYIYRLEKTPNDLDYGKLWGLKNTGQADSRSNGTAGIDIDAERAWDITTGSEDVVVAVIDTGMDYTHPDLKENIWTNMAELNGQAGVDDDGNGYVDDVHGYNFSDAANPTPDPLDDNGHGSHCAGTIGGHGNDGTGIVGVNWKVQIMPVKFLSSGGGGTLESAVLAIDYATKMKARIMSNSWGGGGESDILKAAIQRAADAGILFVAAAGNDGWSTDDTPHFPSNYDVENIVSVAAVDNQGQLASFSNYGQHSVHLAAPGLNIYSSYMGGAYQWLSGTSMATPHVSGVAALLLAQDPKLTATDLKTRMLTTARTMASLRNKTSSGGMVNAYFALKNYQMPPDPNDPYYWASVPLAVSTATHPYAKNAQETYDVEVPGAKEFALYFERFETERKYDKVSFYDHAGTLLFEMTGYQNESYSPTISGDWVRLVFTSDNSVEKYGFDLTKASYR
jgi:subtilisin family serine protease